MAKKARRTSTSSTRRPPAAEFEHSDLLQQMLLDLDGIERLGQFQGRLVQALRRHVRLLQQQVKSARR